MPRRHLKCEKYYLDDATNPYWKVVIEEADLIALAPKPWIVCDITHHDNEPLADEWLLTQWDIEAPPKVGISVEFTCGCD